MLRDLLVGGCATGILVFPGWWVARSRRLPVPALAGFVGGTVALVAIVLGLDAFGCRLSAVSVGGCWLALTVAAVASTRGRAAVPTSPGSRWRESLAAHGPLWLALVPFALVVAWRAVAEPLSGVDTVFRWDYLAAQMARRGTLGFYPPVSGADYEIYAWADGIPPAVSTLYFWAYACAGAVRPVLTAPVVLLQPVLLVAAVHGLARRRFSARAAAFACALLAASPLVGWATTMGQETGLTALSLAALLLYLPDDRAAETDGAAVCAGLAAACGGLAREYGLAFAVFGLTLGLARRLSRRRLGLFLATALLGAGPWYLRNALRTGNPFFNLDLAGLFPVNEVHLLLLRSYLDEYGWGHLPPEALRLFLANTLPLLVAGAAGAVLCFRAARPLLAGVALVAVLWAAALGYTAAGFVYGLRVLSPALALAAVLGGAAAARWIPGRRHLVGAGAALLLLSIDAALRGLALPAPVYRVPPSAWLSVGRAVTDYHARPVYAQLAGIAGGRGMLVLGPNAQLAARGARTVPLWSPEVRCLYDPHLTPAETVRQLAALDIAWVLVNRGAINQRYLELSPFFRRAGNALVPVWADPDMILFKLALPSS